MVSVLVALFLIFTELSLLAFGGGNTILPEMQRHVVDIQHWMTAREFSMLFALAQAAPGPNMMIVPLIGWHVAGWSGLLVASVAKFGPSSFVTALAMGLWHRFKDRPWRRVVQAGLVPMTVGLVSASAFLIAEASGGEWVLIAVTLAVAAVTYRTRLHPLWALAAGALAGWAALGPI